MAEKLFSKYSRDNKWLSVADFFRLCEDLLGPESKNRKGELQKIYKKFNTCKNDRMTAEEFQGCWDQWINKLVNPKTALIIIDVQNDFISGSLALKNCAAGEDAAEVVPVINKILEDHQFDVVVYSKDWHPRDHISFIENVGARDRHPTCKFRPEDVNINDEYVFDTTPPTKQILWPMHCLQDSEGAKMHPDLKIVPDHIVTHKGTRPDFDSYSAFFDNMRASQTDLHERLTERGITDVFVCGVAFDFCVKYTALDARSLGYGCVVIEDACRGVDGEMIARAREEYRKSGCLLKTSKQLGEYLNREVGHPEMVH